MTTKGRRPLQGKVVAITGASAGVGRATALAFAHAGASVGAMARGRVGLNALSNEVHATAGAVLTVSVDVADADALDAAAGQIEAELGPIDIWVNNAMATIFSPVHQISPAEFRRATEVTYLGTVNGTMAALRRMRQRNAGVILQVGSALAYRAIPLQSAYCGAKFAIRGFTDALRVELRHDRSKVHITMVQLSAFNTPQFDWALSRMPRRAQPVPPIFQPEVAAKAIVWAAQAHRREVTVGWPALKAIWGNKLLPSYADRLLAASGYDGQMTDESEAPNRPNNLFSPVDRPIGAHGRFSSRASHFSAQLWITQHRGYMASVFLIALFLVVWMFV